MLGSRLAWAVVLASILIVQMASYNRYNESFPSAHASLADMGTDDIIGRGYSYNTSLEISISDEKFLANDEVSTTVTKYDSKSGEFTLKTVIRSNYDGEKEVTNYESVINPTSNANINRQYLTSAIIDLFASANFNAKLRDITIKPGQPTVIALQGSKYIGMIYEMQGFLDLTYNEDKNKSVSSFNIKETEQIFPESGLVYQADLDLLAPHFSFRYHEELIRTDFLPGTKITTQTINGEAVSVGESDNNYTIMFLFGDDTKILSKEANFNDGYVVLNYETATYSKKAIITLLLPNQLIKGASLSFSSLRLEVDNNNYQGFSLVESDPDSFINVKDLPVGQHKIRFSFTTQPVDVKEFLAYQNPNYGITIHYPANWKKIEPEDRYVKVAFYSPPESASDKFTEIVSVGYENLPYGIKLNDYNDLALQQIKAVIPRFVLVESNETTLAGNAAHKILFTGRDEGGIDIKGMRIWTMTEKKAYFVGFSAEPSKYSSYLSIVQKMIDSFKIDISSPNVVTGRYINSEVGLEIDFPEAWSGIETNKNNITSVFVGPAKTSEAIDKTDFVVIGVGVRNVSGVFSVNTSEIKCDMPRSTTIVKLADMKAMRQETECSDAETKVKMKALNYILLTKDKLIFVMYGATGDSAYEKNIGKFEESLRTLMIKNTIDFSEPSAYASLFGLALSKESILVGGNSYDIAIASNSTIADFTFGEEDKQISFKVVGNPGTKGSTTIYIGKVLQGPYTIAINGKVLNDFLLTEDKTTGETNVSLAYIQGITHITITITGTKLAPGLSISGKILGEQNSAVILVNTKQTKKSTLVSIKNTGDEEIYEIKLHISQGNIKFIKARGWNREKIDSSTVMIKTSDRPITTGRTIILLMISDNPNSTIEWTANNKSSIEIGKGRI